MLQTCFGVYLILALFTFLIFWGTFIEAQQRDGDGPEGPDLNIGFKQKFLNHRD
jgi:hypothetical protein